jgi:hypothetical protein
MNQIMAGALILTMKLTMFIPHDFAAAAVEVEGSLRGVKM